MYEIINLIVDTVASWGYWGIFVMMTIESSFLPFPSEIVMIPAGYLIYQGKMQVIPVILSSALGSVLGALINYYLAMFVGRRFIKKFGKYCFVPYEKLVKAEEFFQKHGSFSTFVGRLIPVIRQLISIPAGLAKMNIVKFIFYTSLGASIWAGILTFIGYFIGNNEEMIKQYTNIVTIVILLCIMLAIFIYVKLNTNKKDNL